MSKSIVFEEHYSIEQRKQKQYFQNQIKQFKSLYNKELDCIRREYSGQETGIEKEICESALRGAYKRYKSNMNQLPYPWCVMISI